MSILSESFSSKAARQQAATHMIPSIPMVNSSEVRGLRTPIMAMNQSQVDFFKAIGNNDLTFGIGPAGTGKTYLAVARAVCELLLGRVDHLVLARPAVEAGEKLGFLPGTEKEKVDPYMRPLYDALYELLARETVEKKIASGEIEIAPVGLLRGRTLKKSFVVIDEAQNTTIGQMKMITSRFGWDSTMAICGDPGQCDLTDLKGERNGLQDAIERHTNSPGIGLHFFDRSHVVRHPTVGVILDNYEKSLPPVQPLKLASSRSPS